MNIIPAVGTNDYKYYKANSGKEIMVACYPTEAVAKDASKAIPNVKSWHWKLRDVPKARAYNAKVPPRK